MAPWHPEDELLVVIDFEPPLPQAIISTAIAIPVSEYSREGLLEVIKEEGEKQLSQSLARHTQEKEENERCRQRREEIDDIARKAELLLKKGAKDWPRSLTDPKYTLGSPRKEEKK